MTNEDLKKILARDYKELRLLLKARAYKSAVVMCGSILEAVLVAVLQNNDETLIHDKFSEIFHKAAPPLNEWELHQLIKVSAKAGILNENAGLKADLLRNYRNLIHPMVQHRKEIEVDAGLVTIARLQLIEILRLLSGTKPPPPPGDGEPRFFRRLEKSGKVDEASVARKIHDLLMKNSFQSFETEAGNYLPRLNRLDGSHSPITMTLDGKVYIKFGRLKRTSRFFKLKDNRLELWRRLNEIPGIVISPDAIDTFPSVGLVVLRDDERLNKFLETFDWVIQNI